MEKQTIESMWTQAMERFKELTGQNLGSAPGDLKKKIEARAAEKDKKASRDTGLKILACVKLLGGVIAQGASTVFGPAELCFGAISVLLDIPQKIRDFNDIIDSVFVAIEPVLSQYKIYARIEQFDRIDDELIIATHSILISLVDICARVINLERDKKWAKLKKFTSAVTCGNEDLKQELEKFDSLVRNQQIVQGSVMLEKVLENKGDLANLLTLASESKLQLNDVRTGVMSLVEAEGTRKSDEMRKEQLLKIKIRLGLEKGATDSSKAVCEDMWKRTLSATGKWFTQAPDFNDWADSECSGTASLLLLTGVPSSGKSFSTSAIVRHLTLAFSVSKQTRRCLIGYHFFSSRSRKTDDEEKQVETALKWIALQLAEQEDAFAKHLADVCLSKEKSEQFFRDADLKTLWTTLKLGAPMPRTTHYILFDAVDGLPKDDIEKLQALFCQTLEGREPSRCSPVRVLASGRNDIWGQDLLQNLHCPVVELDGQHFRDELSGYIESKLRAPDLLPDDSLTERRQIIATRLLELPNINFRVIQNALNDIKEVVASSGSERQLDEVLDRLGRDDVEISRESLEKLEGELTPHEVDLANELLLWVVGGYQFFTFSHLTAAFFLRDTDVPLRGLRNLVENPLKKLFEVDSNDQVQLQAGMIEVVVKKRDISRSSGPQTISLELKISNADVATVQRFFWDLTRFSTLENFSFANSSPNSGSISMKKSISVNVIDAHLAIAKSTVKFLKEPPHPESQPIGEYLFAWFPDHLEALRNARGFDAVSEVEMREIGQCVFELFEDPQMVRTHWATFKNCTSFLDRDVLRMYWDWLHDERVSSGFVRRQKEWLQALKPRRKHQLLFAVVKMVAEIWLRSREGPASDAFLWIKGYISLLTKSKYAFESNEGVNMQVIKAEEWCILNLGANQDSLWQERMAQTFIWARDETRAASRFRAAIELGEHSWNIFKELSDALRGDCRDQEACATLVEAVDTHQDSDDVDKEEKLEVLRTIADMYLDTMRKAAKAEEYYRWVLRVDEGDFEAHIGLVCIMLAVGREEDAQELISAAAIAKAAGKFSEDNLTRLGAMTVHFCESTIGRWWDTPFWRVLTMVATTDSHTVLLRDIDVAIEREKGSSHHFPLCILLLCKGFIHFFRGGQGTDPEQTSSALKCWEGARGTARRNIRPGRWELKFIYTKSLWLTGMFYFDQALSKRQVGSTADSSDDAQRLVVNNVDKLRSLVREFEQLMWGLSPAKAYLASLYTMGGDFEAVKTLYASDMARLSNTLSDGDGSNDSEALEQLRELLMTSGDIKNSYVAAMLIPCFGDQLMSVGFRDLLIELFTLGQHDPFAEGSPAAELISAFDSDCNPYGDVRSTISILLDKANELDDRQLPAVDVNPGGGGEVDGSDRLENGVVKEAAPTPETVDGSDTPSNDTINSVQPAHDIPDQKLETAATVEAAHFNKEHSVVNEGPHKEGPMALQGLLMKIMSALRFNHACCCRGCQLRGWDMGSDVYTCKYCHDSVLCQVCLDQIKANTGPIFACRPTHDWIRLPRLTPKRRAETLMNMVRIPKGVDDEGHFIDGDELVPASVWLTDLMKSWGIERSEWDVSNRRRTRRNSSSPPSPAGTSARSSPRLSPRTFPRPPPPSTPPPLNNRDESSDDEDTPRDVGLLSPPIVVPAVDLSLNLDDDSHVGDSGSEDDGDDIEKKEQKDGHDEDEDGDEDGPVRKPSEPTVPS